ncbi:ribonuclease P protein component [Stenoxybacter acetivorans]|uniref:ribonuclease P protein component n=1 Tax=Stenoxybacter acetivorans TaxID=422441 RepID=UPI0005655315|nr:ribonuclease P protein component [Stenoxybacter acetivorans]
MTFDFGKSYRLLKTEDFSSVFALRRQKRHKYIQIFQAANQLTHPRLGLVVSKKTAKRANRRNYMKRVLREWFRKHQHDLPNNDIVLRVHLAFEQNQAQEIWQTLDNLLLMPDKK